MEGQSGMTDLLINLYMRFIRVFIISGWDGMGCALAIMNTGAQIPKPCKVLDYLQKIND